MSDNDTPTPSDSDAETRPLPSGEAAWPTAPGAAAPMNSEPFVRRHAVAVAIVAAVLAVIVVAGGTAWGVSAAVASTQTAGAPMKPAAHGSHTAAHKTDSRKAGAAKRVKAHVARGAISAISGDTWTVKSASGSTLMVKIDSATTFGTKKSPASRDSFAVGDTIGVIGTRSGTTITAKKIVHVPVHSTATPTPAPTA